MTLIHTTAGALLASALLSAMAAPVALRAELWQPDGDVSYSQDPARPHGVMTIRGGGGAVLKDVDFADGTIEYDINELADNKGIPGIWFRQQGTETAENFYLRTDSDCPVSVECIQYAPVSHGNVEWDVYPEFQAGAPLRASGWNHVKLVIAGKRMNVYINGEQKPSLAVGRLAAEAMHGKVQLRGDAMFANLEVTPGATEGLARDPLVTAVDQDQRYLREWQIAPVSKLARGLDVDYAARPGAALAWEPITAESKGFVNIGRQHGSTRGVPDLAWLKTTVRADRAQTKHVSLGWARQVWVYVNGKPVFADRNQYYPATGRKPPLGRMAIENGGFDVPLAAGANTIEIAISNDLASSRHWGWGFEFRFDDLNGLIPRAPTSAM